MKAVIIVAMCFFCIACSNSRMNQQTIWENYPLGEIVYENDLSTKGGQFFNNIIPDLKRFVSEQQKTVLSTLYFSPEDSIVKVDTIYFSLKDVDGISAKDGGNGVVSIFYSTRYINGLLDKGDDNDVLFETRGVLLHELTHAYQLEPQGIGNYGNSKVFRAFIEGMADAVRIVNGGFKEKVISSTNNYMNGYRDAGYFFVWIKEHKDKDFLKKFNKSALFVIPWSFDGAVKYALGKEADINSLWEEYKKSMNK